MSQNEIHPIDCGDKTENVLTTDNLQESKCFKAFKKILVILDSFFKIPRTYTLSHINDDTDTISRADSERRLCWLMWCFGLCLDFGLAILIVILISFEQNKVLSTVTENENMSPDVSVVQKLVVMFGDGMTLFFAMNKSLELEVVKTHKFTFDKCGFFAYDEINHIQTLVGSPGNLNLIHDPNFNSKRIRGMIVFKRSWRARALLNIGRFRQLADVLCFLLSFFPLFVPGPRRTPADPDGPRRTTV